MSPLTTFRLSIIKKKTNRFHVVDRSRRTSNVVRTSVTRTAVLRQILSWNKKDDQSFEIGKEIEDDFFVFSRARDKEKILSACKESIFRPSDLNKKNGKF